MTNLEITKILALILLLKRRRKNSVVIKVDMVEKSKSFGLAPGTFRKYLNLCIEKGWIVQEKGNTYRCIKLRSIISQFCKETGLVVGYHDFLVKSKGYPKNFRPMHKVVLSALAADNVLAKQEYFREANDLIASDNKRQKSNKKKSRKNNNGPEGYKRVKSALKRL
ncbi:hypothetical protein EBU91_04925, partial [bacterium]|nr:hypothetical protein [bacterium]